MNWILIIIGLLLAFPITFILHAIISAFCVTFLEEKAFSFIIRCPNCGKKGRITTRYSDSDQQEFLFIGKDKKEHEYFLCPYCKTKIEVEPISLLSPFCKFLIATVCTIINSIIIITNEPFGIGFIMGSIISLSNLKIFD